MTIFEAILLGFVQGLTEFLPISSSGHLILVPYLLHLPAADFSLVAIAHEGTLLAVLIYFWRDLWQIAQAVLQGLWQKQPFATTEARLGWYIVVGSIPAVVAGLLFNDYLEQTFRTPLSVAILLLLTTAFLIVGEAIITGKKQLAQMSWLDATTIGFFQMLALMPGVSRSGSTIVGGLARGFDRETAARYSFLLGIPAILGAGVLAVRDVMDAGNLSSQWAFYLAAFTVSFVVGFACIHFLLAWLRQHRLTAFIVYRVGISLLVLLVIFLRS